MMKALLFLAVLVWPASAHLHPFHISVTEVVHKPKERVIQVSVRLFLDDFEETLRSFTDNGLLDIMEEDETYLNEQVGAYLLKNFAITGKKPVELQYLGFEYDRDVMWCYLEGTKVKPTDELQVKSTVMIEIFEDQENLVHVRKEGKVKSLRLTRSKNLDAVRW